MKANEEQGRLAAKNVCIAALKLGIPHNAVIFLEIMDGENVTTDYMRGFASALLVENFAPGFKANTDSRYDFENEFSRGMQTDAEVFSLCKVWALAPNLEEYDRITTTHLIHPDNWVPYAPSGITRKDIAIWQYGKECHPIQTDAGEDTRFNLNLVRNEQLITKNMF